MTWLGAVDNVTLHSYFFCRLGPAGWMLSWTSPSPCVACLTNAAVFRDTRLRRFQRFKFSWLIDRAAMEPPKFLFFHILHMAHILHRGLSVSAVHAGNLAQGWEKNITFSILCYKLLILNWFKIIFVLNIWGPVLFVVYWLWTVYGCDTLNPWSFYCSLGACKNTMQEQQKIAWVVACLPRAKHVLGDCPKVVYTIKEWWILYSLLSAH